MSKCENCKYEIPEGETEYVEEGLCENCATRCNYCGNVVDLVDMGEEYCFDCERERWE